MTDGKEEKVEGSYNSFEAWKHYAAAAGNDKDKMIQVATWLLALSAAIVGFTFKVLVDGPRAIESVAASGLSLIGVGISIVCAMVTLIYGGYANRNWGKADQIARTANWPAWFYEDLPLPEPHRHSLVAWALRQSKHIRPHEELAPIFRFMFWFSIVSLVVHLLVLGYLICHAAHPDVRNHTLTIQFTGLNSPVMAKYHLSSRSWAG